MCVFEYGGLEDREKKGVFCGGRIVTERLFFCVRLTKKKGLFSVDPNQKRT